MDVGMIVRANRPFWTDVIDCDFELRKKLGLIIGLVDPDPDRDCIAIPQYVVFWSGPNSADNRITFEVPHRLRTL